MCKPCKFASAIFSFMKKLGISLFLLLIVATQVLAQDVIQKKGRYLDRETGKPYTGIIKEFSPDQKLISSTCIINGLLNDSTIVCYPSGSMKEIRMYKDGKKHGTWTTWNESGQKTAEASFKDGMKDGFWFVWDDKGVKRYEMFYENGEKKGTWIIRDENGKTISSEDFK